MMYIIVLLLLIIAFGFSTVAWGIVGFVIAAVIAAVMVGLFVPLRDGLSYAVGALCDWMKKVEISQRELNFKIELAKRDLARIQLTRMLKREPTEPEITQVLRGEGLYGKYEVEIDEEALREHMIAQGWDCPDRLPSFK